MSFPEDQVAEVKRFYPDVLAAKDGGITYLVLRDAPLPAGCNPPRMDLLLCPSERDGYTSRLYFAERVTCNNNLNWNGMVRVIERNWHAFSWRVDPGLRLLQMLLAHLGALR
jgi:hypothetical protein